MDRFEDFAGLYRSNLVRNYRRASTYLVLSSVISRNPSLTSERVGPREFSSSECLAKSRRPEAVD